MTGKKTKMIAYGGVLTGLVLAATYFPGLLGRVLPMHGFIHLGDGVIFASAMILGPFAGIVGALGSMLADVFLGYYIYAPATLVIKGLMGLVAGIMLKSGIKRKYLYMLFVFFICELIMVGGYFVYEWALFGYAVAIGDILGNIVQAVAGIALGLAAIPIVGKIFEGKNWTI